MSRLYRYLQLVILVIEHFSGYFKFLHVALLLWSTSAHGLVVPPGLVLQVGVASVEGGRREFGLAQGGSGVVGASSPGAEAGRLIGGSLLESGEKWPPEAEVRALVAVFHHFRQILAGGGVQADFGRSCSGRLCVGTLVPICAAHTVTEPLHVVVSACRATRYAARE